MVRRRKGAGIEPQRVFRTKPAARSRSPFCNCRVHFVSLISKCSTRSLTKVEKPVQLLEVDRALFRSDEFSYR
jgi:hypothetical protein